jgi:L-iditol 2-dehydrogenase
MGHEASGIIARAGEQVRHFQIGDRVTFDSTLSCGGCVFCARGDVNLCERREVIGVSCADYRRHGAFAEYIAVPERIVYRLPDSFSFERAALIEAVSIAVHAAKISQIQSESSAVVVGAGMIGLLAIQAFRVFGCTTVFAIDLEEDRLKLAMQLGADQTFLATDKDLLERVRVATGGQGADIAVEVVGTQKSLQTAIEGVRRGGTVTLIGNLAPKGGASTAGSGDEAIAVARLVRFRRRVRGMHRADEQRRDQCGSAHLGCRTIERGCGMV